jgi:hypothetical protein
MTSAVNPIFEQLTAEKKSEVFAEDAEDSLNLGHYPRFGFFFRFAHRVADLLVFASVSRVTVSSNGISPTDLSPLIAKRSV